MAIARKANNIFIGDVMMFRATPETERKMMEHLRRINSINTLSTIVAFVPTIIAIYIGVPFHYFFALVAAQILVLAGISYYKYRVEKSARKIEAKPSRYVLENTMSYAIFSITLPLLLFLFLLFYSLTSLQRVLTINILFALSYLFVLSNLPASRMKRVSRPLEDSYLIGRADEIAERLGTGKLNIFITSLGRFKIANAATMGARKYYVFMTDYLLENLSPEENVAVIAHEFAHAKEKHVLKTATIAWVITTIAGNMMVYPVDVGTFPALALALPSSGLALLMLSFLLLVPAIQRRFESRADLIAASVVNGMDLVNALQKITRLNFTPSEISRHWSLDHPPTRERVKKIISYTKEHGGNLPGKESKPKGRFQND